MADGFDLVLGWVSDAGAAEATGRMCGPGAAYVTGQSICVNGGSVLH
jgi:hypothetical protein